MSDAPRAILLDGPAKNALGTAMLEHVLGSVRAAAGAPLLLTGAGDAFSAGLNLKELASFDAPRMASFLRLLADTLEALFRYPAPTAAAVNGHAIAGGALLAMVCDFRVATRTPTARIGLNEVALGLRFPPGVLRMVELRVPHAETVVLGADLMGPDEALRLGLLDALADDPLAAAQARLDQLARHPREAYAAAKRDLRGRVVTVDPELDRRFVDEVLPMWTSPELHGRIRAFLDRKGR